jgi:BirA family biotin operon repressor/biotin-[acetyl-CoA-carboxylase] ligase
MSLDTLLSVLADGQFHSGDDLGELLGVSRTAVWKQLKKVEELGLSLQSIKGKGYCIEGGLDLLSEKAVKQSLSNEADQLIANMEFLTVVDSTSVIAMRQAMQGVSAYVCSAEQQTAGRGRRGRVWNSPYASNIYLSMVWEFAGGAVALEGLSLAVGVVLVDALSEAGVEGVELKWPNDILYKGRKLAGILLEISGDAAGPCSVVVGIGLNVAMPPDTSIDQPWTDIKTIQPAAADRNRLLALMLNRLMPLLADFEQFRFVAYRDRWQALDAYKGREVAVSLGPELILGTAVGVDDSGALLLDTEVGRRSFNGGEVSLRVVV